MADESPNAPIYSIPYLRLFPWLRIFRCPGAATDPKRLMLAAVGLWLMGAGWGVLDRVFPASSGITPVVFEIRKPIGPDSLALIPWWMTEPARFLSAPFYAAFNPADDPWSVPHAILAAVWVVAVWGLIGGAISRIAVVGLAKGERVGFFESLRFAGEKAVSLVGTPLIPMLGVVVVGSLIAAFGVLYRLPFGPTVAGLLAFLPLVGGLLLTMIVIGLAVGWPLMQASVAAEAEDGFDAVSRTYAYVHQRPWHYLGYALLALAVGCAGLLFVEVFARLVVHLTAWSLGFGGPSAVVSGLYSGVETDMPDDHGTHGFWLAAIAWLVRAWVYSAFWTAASAIYLLLRRDVDGTPFNAIAFEARPNLFAEALAEAQRHAAPTAAKPDAPDLQELGEVAGT